MLPAVGQGIVAVECAEQDLVTREHLAKIEDAQSRLSAEAEREVLWMLNGHCNSPIAGHATIASSQMTLRASVLDETGDRFIEVSRRAPRTARANSAARLDSSCSTRALRKSSRARGRKSIRSRKRIRGQLIHLGQENGGEESSGAQARLHLLAAGRRTRHLEFGGGRSGVSGDHLARDVWREGQRVA